MIPAAGIGRRMGSDIPKQYLKIGGATMLERTVSVFVRNPRIRRVIVALAPGDPYFAKLPLASDPRISVCEGGAERADTVLRALALAQGPYALVHDAARPLLCDEDLNALLDAGLSCDDGALLAVPMADTVKRGEGGRCQGTVPRAGLWRALTPQTSEFQSDRACRSGAGALADLCRRKTVLRIGHGFDVHRFGGPGPVTLGGVKVPSERGLIAHSDGDVVIHAVCDALLGALALGDIGHFYPDNDDRFLNIDSRALLRDVRAKIASRGFHVVNVDATAIAQVPKLAPYEERMRVNLAADLQTDVSCVSIKATTSEKLGFTGRGEGIAVEAVCLVESN